MEFLHTAVTSIFGFRYRLGKDDFQKLTQSYPDLLQKVESLAIERIERLLLIEEREKHRKPFGYVSVNQPQFPSDKRSTTFWVYRKINFSWKFIVLSTHSLTRLTRKRKIFIAGENEDCHSAKKKVIVNHTSQRWYVEFICFTILWVLWKMCSICLLMSRC